MPFLPEREIDQALLGLPNVDRPAHLLTDEGVRTFALIIERTQWWVLNTSLRPETARQTVCVIQEKLGHTCTTYANYLWQDAALMLDEDMVVRIVGWCYLYRGTLDLDAKVGVKTSFIDDATKRLHVALNGLKSGSEAYADINVPPHDACKKLVRSIWLKHSGQTEHHDAAYCRAVTQLVKACREKDVALPITQAPRDEPRHVEVAPGARVRPRLDDLPGIPGDDLGPDAGDAPRAEGPRVEPAARGGRGRGRRGRGGRAGRN